MMKPAALPRRRCSLVLTVMRKTREFLGVLLAACGVLCLEFDSVASMRTRLLTKANVCWLGRSLSRRIFKNLDLWIKPDLQALSSGCWFNNLFSEISNLLWCDRRQQQFSSWSKQTSPVDQKSCKKSNARQSANLKMCVKTSSCPAITDMGRWWWWWSTTTTSACPFTLTDNRIFAQPHQKILKRPKILRQKLAWKR